MPVHGALVNCKRTVYTVIISSFPFLLPSLYVLYTSQMSQSGSPACSQDLFHYKVTSSLNIVLTNGTLYRPDCSFLLHKNGTPADGRTSKLHPIDV